MRFEGGVVENTGVVYRIHLITFYNVGVYLYKYVYLVVFVMNLFLPGIGLCFIVAVKEVHCAFRVARGNC